MKEIPQDIVTLLNTEAARINHPDFIASDPVQFPRLYSEPRDIEIVSLLVSTIAWGKRTMICNNAGKMLDLMDHRPYDFTMDGAAEELPDMNIHRTFFSENLKHYLRGLKLLYSRYGSLENMVYERGIAESHFPAWEIAAEINAHIAEANSGKTDSRCLPVNLDASALKRLNMALRWLVRNDGIVDLGIWDVLKPSQLFIPLDVHVGNISRQLGLLERKSNDRKAVTDLTDTLRALRPQDPVYYDYALFGIGVNAK
ncbi:MAG: TIGR02757 family protein [Muribaculaceae bacterium]|nr:TIGR02757 family protein [Muribaculaceae bacterium]